MAPTRATVQGGGTRSRGEAGQARLSERLTLPVTPYEREAIQRLAVHRGLLQAVATRHGSKVKGAGVGLLRVLSLQQIVVEFERLKATGEIAA